MLRRILKSKRAQKRSFVEPDEIFLDSKNLQNFDRQQFEGRIEKPIAKKSILGLSIVFMIIILVFGGRLVHLQINKGEAYFTRSENNILEKDILFADRGIIYDRNKIELAWNKKIDFDLSDLETDLSTKNVSSVRAYISPGFSHLLGYVSYPSRDKSGNFWQEEFIGKDGIEKQYNDRLKGENGSKIIETNALGETYSENTVNVPKKGADLVTSIDSRIQGELYNLIKSLAESAPYQGGAGVIMDVQNGEVIALTSYPEYNSEVLSLGEDREAINGYITDKRKFFLDRTISGLYTPGSIVKPILGLGALVEGVIDENKKILSTGSIAIPNPYDPKQETVFKDWRVNGWTNMAEAIAVSSDIYFYAIGGGYKDQKGMGIANIEKYSKMFGIGSPTGIDLPDEKQGVIPSPSWKEKNFKGDIWRIGDTYHTSIGQYGFQATPMEMMRATAALANRGTLLTPHVLLGDTDKEKLTSSLEIPKKYFDIIHDGMRQTVTNGTAVSLNVPYVNAAAKTGTAQVGISKNRVNSWVVGFFPYENPKYAFTVMMEAGPTEGASNAASVMRGLFDWMYWKTPEYFTKENQ